MQIGDWLRRLRLAVAIALATMLVVVGLSVWTFEPILAVCLVAAGQCVAMWWIADELFPRASRSVTGTIRLIAALIFLGNLVGVIYVFS